MKQLLLYVIGVSLLLGLQPTKILCQEFEWLIEGPEHIHDNELIEVNFSLLSSEIPEGQLGVDGFQVGVGHENLILHDLSIEGTDIEAGTQNGFVSLEPTTGFGNEGFIGGVVLSIEQDPFTLPTSGASSLVKATYQVKRAGCFIGTSIEVRDGLELNDGDPLFNRISQNNHSFEPTFGRLDYEACQDNAYNLLIVSTAESFYLRPEQDPREFEVQILLQQEFLSVKAWDLAFSFSPEEELEVLYVDIEGLGLEEHQTDAGFITIEHTQGANNFGFVVKADLSPDVPWLIPQNEQALIRMGLRLPVIEELPEDLTELRFELRESLRGAGGLVTNRILPAGDLTIESALVIPVTLDFSPAFVRGDSNGDGRVDISDPLLILGYLFLGDPARCKEAMDIDAGGAIDLADAVALLTYQFLDGFPPRAPFPDCGRDYVTYDCEITACP